MSIDTVLFVIVVLEFILSIILRSELINSRKALQDQIDKLKKNLEIK